MLQRGLSAVPNQPAVVSVAAPTVIQQQVEVQNQEVVDAQVVGAKWKETEGLSPSKKKKRIRRHVSDARNQDIILMIVLHLFVTHVSPYIMQPLLVIFCKLRNPL
jgi:hypothetical protein